MRLQLVGGQRDETWVFARDLLADGLRSLVPVGEGDVHVQATSVLTEITRRMATYDMVAMPVVDGAYRLVGAVTVDDVLDHSLPRDWRDRDADSTEEPAGILPGAER